MLGLRCIYTQFLNYSKNLKNIENGKGDVFHNNFVKFYITFYVALLLTPSLFFYFFSPTEYFRIKCHYYRMVYTLKTHHYTFTKGPIVLKIERKLCEAAIDWSIERVIFRKIINKIEELNRKDRETVHKYANVT